MIKILVLMLLGHILLFGLYLFINSNLKDLKEISIKKNIAIGSINAIATLLGAIYINRYDVLLILLMLIQANILLIGEKQENIFSMVMKAIGYILLMIFSELMGMFYFGRYLEKSGLSLTEFYDDVLIRFLLAMCLTSVLILYIYQLIFSKTRTQRSIWMLVSVKILQEIIGLHASVFFTRVSDMYIKDILIYIPFLLADYLIYVFLVFKFEEKRVQTYRAEIQTNSYEYYMNLEEEQRKIRKLYHDMKNQIMIYENKEGLKDILRPMMDNIQTMSHFHHTGSTVLDMLLFNGKRIAIEKDIEYEATVSEGSFSFMEEKDLSIIFSNAIMNAIEACEKITVGPRKIQIKAGINSSDVMLYIKNTTSGERKKGNFVTDKVNKKFHGIGLTSIRETVEKYDGYLSIIEEDNTVQLAIIFVGKGRNEKV